MKRKEPFLKHGIELDLSRKTGAVAGGYPVRVQLPQLFDGPFDSLSCGLNQVESPDDSFDISNPCQLYGMPNNIHDPRMATTRDNDEAFPFHLRNHGHIIEHRISLDSATIEGK